VSDPAASPNLDTVARFTFDTQRTDKPWGHELLWALTDRYAGKILFVKTGEALSLQFHREKDEAWYVLLGRAEIEVGAAGDAVLGTEILTAGEALHFPPGTVHRVRALEDTHILEVSTPHLDDVVRLEDAYGRADTTQ
jgi:mannose-6-phosphate isomerase